jgi:superfamily II DNA or RNA helicase
MLTTKKMKKIPVEKTWNQLNATNYEYYCVNYHRENLGHLTWHWGSTPESVLFESGFLNDFRALRLKRKQVFESEGKHYNLMVEYGLDGFSFDQVSYHGVQCKLWDSSLTLNSSHLDTFFSAMERLTEKNELSKAYLYYTCKLNPTLKMEMDVGDLVIRNKLSFDEEKKNEFLNEMKDLDVKPEDKDEISFELFDYQQRGVEALRNDWRGVKLLNLPCGTGKTVIFNHHVTERRYKNIFILSPLKVHVRQNLERMKRFLPDYQTLLLDSDRGGSTDIDDLVSALDTHSIISSTFDSAENVMKQLFEMEEKEEDESEMSEEGSMISNESRYTTQYDLSDTILIVDEAHNMIMKDELIKIVKSFPKVLLVTATPPKCMEEIMECEVVYQYPFRKAIEEKHICDYQIYIPLLVMNEMTEKSEVLIEKPVECVDLDDDLTKKCLYLINGILQTGSRRCIAYLDSMDECAEFENVFTEVMNRYHCLPFGIRTITAEVGERERSLILNEFQRKSHDDEIKIICSIRILNEGVDIPICDSVFIANVGEYASDITMVQRMCRANRLLKGNPQKISNCFLWTTDTNKIVGSLSLLKENDLEFHKKIRVMNGDYEKQGDKKRIKMVAEKTEETINFVKVKCMKLNEIWEMKKQLLFKFCEENGRLPRQKEKINGMSLGDWFQDAKRLIHSDKESLYSKFCENEILKNSIDRCLEFREKNKDMIHLDFDRKKELLFKYCDEYKKVPMKGTIYNDINIGGFIISIKKKMKTKDCDSYKILSGNELVKTSLDMYLIGQEKKKILFL